MVFAAGDILEADDLNRLPPIKGVRITNAGNPIGSTSGTTELDLPKYALSSLTLVTNRYYLYRAMITFTKTVGTDDFDARLRVNTATSGTQIGISPVNFTEDLTIGFKFLDILFLGDSSYTSLHLSVFRSAGTGTLSYFGATSGYNRAFAFLYDLGDNIADVA